MAINSMQKGAQFERDMAKLFSQFWDGTLTSVTRVPLSGGYPRGKMWGDLICSNSVFFPFLVSLKKVEGWSLDQLFFHYDRSQIIVWLREIQQIFYKYLKGQKWIESRYLLLPILVIAKNRYDPIVIIDIQDLDRLKPHLIGKLLSDHIQIMRLGDLRICLLQVFFDITKNILSKEKLFQDLLMLNIYTMLYQVDQKYIKAVMDKELEISNKEHIHGY